ncbi:capsular polysaccharide biosynthesis protein [Haloferula helveola]|uniref:Capsular polysaccharide biosynthesis protein n=1 Tax=Haloferula helveola TaxID=490095 RepID=A0ABN6H5Q4_9BACT|nr:capsular polysaccharide biosynthesis protein [Haloferula helveola]
MKRKLLTLLAAAATTSALHAQEGLYYLGSEAQESLPLKWMVGVNATYDDNVSPTAVGIGANESAFSLNPYVGLSFVNMTPQSTLDVYARLGAIYYIDGPSAPGTDDLYPQIRAGVNWTRRFTERLRFSSRNFVAYELEPDYAYGFATSRQVDAYIFWGTDNAIGYRWTERLATYTGFALEGVDYDSNVTSADRFTWELYHQFRYQLTPQSVLTFDYRYADTSAGGLASDSSSHYLLLGLEHRFSPNTILVAKAGAQIKRSDAIGGSDGTSPFVELAMRSQVNEQFSIRAFVRYSSEVYDTVRVVTVPGASGLYDFDDRQTLRVGIKASYDLSPKVSIFGGVDYIPSAFDDGRLTFVNFGAPAPVASGIDEDLLNLYIGLTVRFTERLYGSLSYNYTDNSSDFAGYSYDRNRINFGLHAEF